MAICVLTKDILKTTNCGYSLPTVTDIYLANMEDVTSVDLNEDPTNGEDVISAITLVPDTKFYHIEPNKDSVEFSDTLASGSTGNKYRVVTLTFSVGGSYTKEMHAFLDGISLGRYFGVIKNAEGNYIALGRQTGIEASAADLTAGTDTNGIQVTLTANVAESSLTLTKDAIDDVLGN